MTDQAEPQDPETQAKPVRGEALDTDEGVEVPGQQPTGPENRRGGGEWPDPHAPPQAPAPGAVDGGEGDKERQRP